MFQPSSTVQQSDRPSDADVLAALRVLAGWLGIGSNSPAAYTADSLPPDCTSRDAFLRRHRERTKSKVPGWTRSGQTRAVTRQAWELDVAEETQRARTRRRLSIVAPPERAAANIDDEVLVELGAKRATGGRR